MKELVMLNVEQLVLYENYTTIMYIAWDRGDPIPVATQSLLNGLSSTERTIQFMF